MRAAAELHAEDDDFGQANAIVNKATDAAARARLVANVVGRVTATSSSRC